MDINDEITSSHQKFEKSKNIRFSHFFSHNFILRFKKFSINQLTQFVKV